MRRIYLYLFAVQLLAWFLKLSGQPTPIGSFSEFVSRAETGFLPGSAMLALTFAGFAGLAIFAFHFGGVDRSPAAIDPITD